MFVVPAVATTANGVEARGAVRGDRSGDGGDRQPERRRPTAAPAPRPPPSPSGRAGSSRAPGRDRYTTPPPPRASRAATSAVSDAIEPPLVNSPSVPAGIPHHARSQSTTVSSTVDGPDDATHDVPSRLKPDDDRVGQRDT